MNDTGKQMTVAELVHELHSLQNRNAPQKMEFSKKAFIFASIIFAATWMVAVFSWFSMGVIPWEFTQWISLMYGAVFTSYCGKTAYENKPKIKGWGDER